MEVNQMMRPREAINDATFEFSLYCQGCSEVRSAIVHFSKNPSAECHLIIAVRSFVNFTGLFYIQIGLFY